MGPVEGRASVSYCYCNPCSISRDGSLYNMLKRWRDARQWDTLPLYTLGPQLIRVGLSNWPVTCRQISVGENVILLAGGQYL